jgi:hypothetical protein
MAKTTKPTQTTEETIKVTGENLLKTVKDLTLITFVISPSRIKTANHRVSTIGVVGAVFLPV